MRKTATNAVCMLLCAQSFRSHDFDLQCVCVCYFFSMLVFFLSLSLCANVQTLCKSFQSDLQPLNLPGDDCIERNIENH